MTGRLLCVGDLNADISIATETEIAVGSDTPGQVRFTAGGSAANVAAIAAEAGTPTRFAGVVGDDLLGGLLIDRLRGDGVDVEPIVRVGASSNAVAAVISPNGDRSMVSDVDRDTTLRLDDIEPKWFDDLEWMHLTAYTWFSSGGDEVFARLVDVATQLEIAWSVDPSSAQMLRTGRPITEALVAFDGAAVMFPSHDEAAVLSGVEDPIAAATRLLDLAATVAVTCGADGAVVATRGRSVVQAAAHEVEVVNSLGAGDAFAAGFISARLVGQDDEAAMHAGLELAAEAVARPTAR